EVARGPACARVVDHDVVLDAAGGAVGDLDAVLYAVRGVAVATHEVLAHEGAHARILHHDAGALVGLDRIALDPDPRASPAALHEDADAVRAAGRRAGNARPGDAGAEDRG